MVRLLFAASSLWGWVLCATPAFAAVPLTRNLAFDGVDDVATVAHHTSLAPTAQVTVEAWVKLNSISTTLNQDRVLAKVGSYELTVSSGDTGCGFNTQGHVQWRATIGGKDGRVCAGQLTFGSWYHIAGTHNGSRFILYIDGVPVADVARTGAIATNTSPLFLGNRPELNRPFDGALDEVRIWNRALTQVQLQAGMEQTLSGDAAGLLAYYRFEEGSGQTFMDLGPQANQGVRGASSATESSDPSWVTGGAPSNQAPQVDAGSDQTVTSQDRATSLQGVASDDGLPDGTFSASWFLQSGPGNAVFQNSDNLNTGVSFTTDGLYVLELTVTDGEYTVSDTVRLQVQRESVVVALELAPALVTLGTGEQQTFSAVGRDATGNSEPVTVTWSATNGSISTSGVYSPPTVAGQYTVTAVFGSLSATATVVATGAPTLWPTTGWVDKTPEEAGMQSELLEQAKTYALTGGGSGFITRGGALVYSWGSPSLRYDLKSTTKSIGGTLVGLALGDGIVALSDSAQTLLPSFGVPPTSNIDTTWLDEVTLSHLATHTAGFDKPGGYIALLFAPGSTWSYSDGGANWLADVLTRTYGADLNSILFTRVLNTLGLTSSNLVWRENNYREKTLDGVKRREFGSGIFADVNAMARLGYLYLRRGMWAGQRLLPEDFIQGVQKPSHEVIGLPVNNTAAFPNASNHYGLLWWTNADGTLANVPRDAYWSWGLGDSLIVVIPSLDIVISRAGNGWRSGWNANYAALEPFLGPIVASTLAQNPGPAISGGLSFDGIDDIGTVAHRSSLAPSSRITVEAWVKLNSISTTIDQDRVLSKVGSYELTVSSGDTNCGFSTQGQVQWRATIGGVDRRICGGQLSFGTWHHVAGTYDGARFVLYVDGIAVANVARTGAIAASTSALYLGNRPELNKPLDGALSEVRVWGRALSQAQIQAGKNQTLVGNELELRAYYRLEDGSGQTVTDSSTNANHGVRGASSAAESNDPQWVATP